MFNCHLPKLFGYRLVTQIKLGVSWLIIFHYPLSSPVCVWARAPARPGKAVLPVDQLIVHFIKSRR